MVLMQLWDKKKRRENVNEWKENRDWEISISTANALDTTQKIFLRI